MRTLYRALVPYETRLWLYKLRHPAQYRRLRTQVNRHDKANFSLKPFDDHRAIFVHITKSAGTSVATGLFGALPYHYTAIQYRVIYGRKTFREYYKFAFVRNPWDRLYSAYSYLKGGGWDDRDKAWAGEHLSDIEDFNQFVLEWLTPERLYSHIHFWPQSRFICDRRGRPLINDLACFETISEDFNRIAATLGVEARLEHVNASRRASYRDAYTPAAIERVQDLYADDIERLGYSFDGYQRMCIQDGRFTPA